MSFTFKVGPSKFKQLWKKTYLRIFQKWKVAVVGILYIFDEYAIKQSNEKHVMIYNDMPPEKQCK